MSPTRISPSAGVRMPARHARSVVLPEPLGPSRTTSSPSPASTLSPSTGRTTWPPWVYSMVRSLIVRFVILFALWLVERFFVRFLVRFFITPPRKPAPGRYAPPAEHQRDLPPRRRAPPPPAAPGRRRW